MEFLIPKCACTFLCDHEGLNHTKAVSSPGYKEPDTLDNRLIFCLLFALFFTI